MNNLVNRPKKEVIFLELIRSRSLVSASTKLPKIFPYLGKKKQRALPVT